MIHAFRDERLGRKVILERFIYDHGPYYMANIDMNLSYNMPQSTDLLELLSLINPSTLNRCQHTPA